MRRLGDCERRSSSGGRLYDLGDKRNRPPPGFPYKIPILKRRLFTSIMLDPGILWIVQLDVRAHTIEYQVTENMLGILSARVPREVSKNTTRGSNCMGFLHGNYTRSLHPFAASTWQGERNLQFYVEFSVIPFCLPAF